MMRYSTEEEREVQEWMKAVVLVAEAPVVVLAADPEKQIIPVVIDTVTSTVNRVV